MKRLFKRDYAILSPLTPGQAKAALQENCAGILEALDAKPFSGSVREDGFEIKIRGAGRNSFRPVLHGRILDREAGGSRIEVRARLHAFVQVFTLVWLTLNCVFLYAGIRLALEAGQWSFFLTALGFMLAYFAMAGCGFHFSERKAVGRLKTLLKAEDVF